jgi:hypothetical protein
MSMRSAYSSIFDALGVRIRNGGVVIESLPFSVGDITAGTESELQTVVVGDKSAIDLARTIEQSNYYANITRHIAAGDTPRRAITRLERYLNENDEKVWENSWVRFPMATLSEFARQTFQSDLLADKRDHRRGMRDGYTHPGQLSAQARGGRSFRLAARSPSGDQFDGRARHVALP